MASKKNGSADDAGYLKAVEEGKAITAEISSHTTAISGKQWVLGDLADKVDKAYGENRLARFASDINFDGAECTLGRYRDVCRAFPKGRVRPRFFACAQALAGHPDRFAIFERNPDISKADARKLMKKWRDENQTEAEAEDDGAPLDDDEDETGPTPTAPSTSTKAATAKGPKKTASEEQATLKENRRLFNNIVDLANKAIDEAGIMKNCTPEQKCQLALVIEPRLVKEIAIGGRALVALADWFTKLVDAESNAIVEEGRVNTSPKRASAPSQVTI